MLQIPQNILEGWVVVVIEDEPDSIKIAKILLEEFGAKVHAAMNGKDGLDLVRAVKPNFILSDLSMPVMDGWEFINNLLNDHHIAHIPVIALTAHAMTGDRRRAIEVGFHNYLTKPLKVSTFINDVVSLLVDIPEIAEKLEI